tara:strand:- start:44 stop:1531 length:1488 start_codon:yes stop_codon:yes gene_type:complete
MKITRKQLKKIIYENVLSCSSRQNFNTIHEISLKRKVRSYTLNDYKSEDFKNNILEYIDSGLSSSYERVFKEWRDKVSGTFSEIDTNRFIDNLRKWTRSSIESELRYWSMQDIMKAFLKDVGPGTYFRSNNESTFMYSIFGDNWRADMSEYVWDADWMGQTFKEAFINGDTYHFNLYKDPSRLSRSKPNLHNLTGFVLKFVIFELLEHKIDQLSREQLLLSMRPEQREAVKKVKRLKTSFMNDFKPYKNDWDFYHFLGAFISDNGKSPLENLKTMTSSYINASSRDEIAAIAIPKNQSSLDGWNTLHKSSAIGFKLSGVVTSMYSGDVYSTVFSQVDVPPVGGVRKSSGFNRHPGESMHHDPDPEFMLAYGRKKIMQAHRIEALGNKPDGFNWRQSGENYIESFVDNWKISAIVLNLDLFAEQFAQHLDSYSFYGDNLEPNKQLQYKEIDDCVTFFIELADAGFDIYAAPDIKTPLRSSALGQIGELIEEKLNSF